MAIAMVAMLAFGGTYAYFTSSVSGLASGDAKAAKISLAATGDTFKQTTLSQKILPTEYLFGGTGDAAATLTIQDTSNRASYVFVKFEVKAYKLVANVKTGGVDSDSDTYHDTPTVLSVALTDTSKVQLSGATGIAFTAITEAPGVYGFLTTGATYNEAADLAYAGGTFTIAGTGVNIQIPGEWDDEYQEAKIEVEISIESIQAVGMTDEQDAWSKLNPEG